MDRGIDPPQRHPQKALTSVRINSLAKPGRYADGNGLYLVVDPSGAKRWVLRTMVQGKRRDIGLGGLRLVSLAEARTKALEYRKLARGGGNPIEARRLENTTTTPR
jgi:Arm DNA-binding domain